MASGCTSESCHALQEGRGPLSPRSQWCWGGTEDVAFRRERTPVGSAAHPVTHFPHGLVRAHDVRAKSDEGPAGRSLYPANCPLASLPSSFPSVLVTHKRSAPSGRGWGRKRKPGMTEPSAASLPRPRAPHRPVLSPAGDRTGGSGWSPEGQRRCVGWQASAGLRRQ